MDMITSIMDKDMIIMNTYTEKTVTTGTTTMG